MTLYDMIGLGLDNLRRTKLRTMLTTLGVVIGIGALTSMVSFGTGMQRNITEAFRENDLFTSLFVTPKELDVEQMVEGDLEGVAEALRGGSALLKDSVLTAIQEIPGVEIAFPEITFPVKLRLGDHETRTTVQALPSGLASRRPFDDMTYGEFFSDDSTDAVVIRWRTLKRMGVLVRDEQDKAEAPEDSLEDLEIVHPDSIIGKPIEIVSAVFDPSEMPSDPLAVFLRPHQRPFKETVTELTVGGILRRPNTFSGDRFDGGVFIPLKTAQRIPRLGFSSVWDLLSEDETGEGYGSIYVRVETIADVQPAREAIEGMGLGVFSISDELKEIRRGFLIVDSILGAIGTIALVVAALGIANTMIMSILERTREIGVMKAIGGSESQIRMIFFVEAGTIGVIGALFGLVLGWGVTRLANVIVNAHLLPAGETPVSLFYFPIWLILGAIGFSVVMSLVAGLYPATRAARVDPVTALRHD
jgi:putative ABC transport system permease protein